MVNRIGPPPFVSFRVFRGQPAWFFNHKNHELHESRNRTELPTEHAEDTEEKKHMTRRTEMGLSEFGLFRVFSVFRGQPSEGF